MEKIFFMRCITIAAFALSSSITASLQQSVQKLHAALEEENHKQTQFQKTSAALTSLSSLVTTYSLLENAIATNKDLREKSTALGVAINKLVIESKQLVEFLASSHTPLAADWRETNKKITDAACNGPLNNKKIAVVKEGIAAYKIYYRAILDIISQGLESPDSEELESKVELTSTLSNSDKEGDSHDSQHISKDTFKESDNEQKYQKEEEKQNFCEKPLTTLLNQLESEKNTVVENSHSDSSHDDPADDTNPRPTPSPKTQKKAPSRIRKFFSNCWSFRRKK